MSFNTGDIFITEGISVKLFKCRHLTMERTEAHHPHGDPGDILYFLPCPKSHEFVLLLIHSLDLFLMQQLFTHQSHSHPNKDSTWNLI